MQAITIRLILAVIFISSLTALSGCNEDLSSQGYKYSPDLTGPAPDNADTHGASIAISSPPRDVNGFTGDTATFSVTAHSSSSLHYQWFHNGNLIAGATSSSLSFVIGSNADAGTYLVEISNDSDTLSKSAQLTVGSAPDITRQPLDVSLYPGDTAVFTVAATGDNLQYEWQTRSLTGWETTTTTTDTLVVEDVSTSTTTQYRVKVKNGGGTKTSRTTRINVKSDLSISSQPISVTTTAGANVNFSVTASGYGTLSYQWYKAGTAISNGSKFSGSNSATLGISSVTNADASLYHVVVSNQDGFTLASNPAQLSLSGPIAITVNPTDTKLYTGQSGSLNVGATGDGPISYQWQKWNGSSWSYVSGATSARLTFSAASTGNAGLYRCAIKNSVSSQVSATATVTVLESVKITQSPASLTVAEGSSAKFTVAASGDNLQYEWTKDGQVISGNSSSLTFAAARSTDAATYGCRVFNAGSSVRCSSFTLAVQSQVSISQQPVSATGYEDGSVTLAVAHTGDSSTSVKWYRNGVLVASGKQSLTLSPLSMSDAGSYQCEVSNSVNTLKCNSVTVTVLEKVRITKQLSSQVLTAGDLITLDIAATGALPITYRCFKDGTLLVTSTSPTDLIIPGSTESDSGSYYCEVSNAGSRVTSTSATITVLVDYKGTIELAWSAPASREDGSSLTNHEIQRYNIYMSTNRYSGFELAKSTETTSAAIGGLAPNTYYLSLTTVDTNNMESMRSSPVAVRVQ